jgi:hypothetical protein
VFVPQPAWWPMRQAKPLHQLLCTLFSLGLTAACGGATTWAVGSVTGTIAARDLALKSAAGIMQCTQEYDGRSYPGPRSRMKARLKLASTVLEGDAEVRTYEIKVNAGRIRSSRPIRGVESYDGPLLKNCGYSLGFSGVEQSSGATVTGPIYVVGTGGDPTKEALEAFVSNTDLSSAISKELATISVFVNSVSRNRDSIRSIDRCCFAGIPPFECRTYNAFLAPTCCGRR